MRLPLTASQPTGVHSRLLGGTGLPSVGSQVTRFRSQKLTEHPLSEYFWQLSIDLDYVADSWSRRDMIHSRASWNEGT